MSRPNLEDRGNKKMHLFGQEGKRPTLNFFPCAERLGQITLRERSSETCLHDICVREDSNAMFPKQIMCKAGS